MSNLPVAYSITHEGLQLDIALVETDKLHIHEETIPERLDNLKRRVERDGVQSAPILVDRHNLVVLDGMHRTAVMTYLNCRFTCVCMLDYFDDSIKVQRWCRVIPGPFSERHAKDFLDSVGLSMEHFEIVKSPDEDSGLLIVFRDTAYKLMSDSNDLVDLFRRSYQLELNLEEYGYEIKHCTESQAIDLMSSGY